MAHTVAVTTASVHDKTAMPKLLHGDERIVLGDKGYVSDTDKQGARQRGGYLEITRQSQTEARAVHQTNPSESQILLRAGEGGTPVSRHLTAVWLHQGVL